jgi:hypothetical protein
LNALGEFDKARFELNEIYFEDYQARHLVCVTTDRFAGLEGSSMVFVFHHCGLEWMLDDECAFHWPSPNRKQKKS